jgi:hypothetical protein
LNKIVDYPTTPPFASILLFLHSVAIYNTTAESSTDIEKLARLQDKGPENKIEINP